MMKRKIISVLICCLLVATTVIIFVPGKQNVKADTSGENEKIIDLDTNLIYDVTSFLSAIIDDSYDPGELAKGRAFGTPGEHDAKNYIWLKMNESGLISSVDQIEPIDSLYPVSYTHLTLPTSDLV